MPHNSDLEDWLSRAGEDVVAVDSGPEKSGGGPQTEISYKIAANPLAVRALAIHLACKGDTTLIERLRLEMLRDTYEEPFDSESTPREIIRALDEIDDCVRVACEEDRVNGAHSTRLEGCPTYLDIRLSHVKDRTRELREHLKSAHSAIQSAVIEEREACAEIARRNYAISSRLWTAACEKIYEEIRSRVPTPVIKTAPDLTDAACRVFHRLPITMSWDERIAIAKDAERFFAEANLHCKTEA